MAFLPLVLLKAVGASSAFGLMLVQLKGYLCKPGYFLCSSAQVVPDGEAWPQLSSLTTAGNSMST